MTTITILGCGGSNGVPMIGGENGAGYWGSCNPDNPRNRRTRCSIVVETQGKKLLIDTPPDLREQLLREKIYQVDAVLYTHAHADHLHGIDDIRQLNFHAGKALPLYADAITLADIQRRFDYIFTPLKPESGFYKPSVNAFSIAPPQPFTIEDIVIQPFLQNHGYIDSIGYRFGNIAYSTDVKYFYPESESFLHNLDVWIIDCLQIEPHPTHAEMSIVLGWIEKFKPKKAILTHLNASLDYDTLRRILPPHIEPAYDGMKVFK